MRLALCVSLLVAMGGCHDGPVTPIPAPSPIPAPPPATPPPPQGPTAPPLRIDLVVGPASPQVGDRAAFQARSLDPYPTPATFAWTFGDGQVSTTGEDTIFHAYDRVGFYDAAVQVTDASSRTATARARVQVIKAPEQAPAPPTAPPGPPTLTVSLTCSPPLTIGPATPCNVTASYGGQILPSARISKVDWDWGDGVAESTPVPVHTHVYIAGTYTVFATVTATTPDGPRTATASITLTVPKPSL